MQDNKKVLFTPEFLADYSNGYSKISYAARIEKLAEESAELAAAASKYARIVRDEFPSKMNDDEARNEMMEEIVDVVAAIETLALLPDLPKIHNTSTNDQLFMQEHAYHQMLKFIRRTEHYVPMCQYYNYGNPMADAIVEDLDND